MLIVPPLPTLQLCKAAATAAKLDTAGVLTRLLPLPPSSHPYHHAAANALPRRYHHCRRAANTTVELPTAAMLLLRCRRCLRHCHPCAATAATAAALK